MDATPSRLVFNHFPKAAGTSFFSILKQNIAESEISPQLMEQEIRLARPERFEHYRLIRGHFSILTQMGFARNRYSMTLLRDPISTIVSTYNFWRTRAEQDPVTAEAKRLTFAEFVRRYADSPAIICNTYTHHFAAVSRDYPGKPGDEKLLLEYAKHNLAAFNFVGVCEQLEESVRLLCQELRWRGPAATPHENRSLQAQAPEAVDSETREILREQNQLDLQLYAYARTLFAKRCARTVKSWPSSGYEQGALAESDGWQTAVEPNRFLAFPIPLECRREASVTQVRANWVPQQPARLEIEIAYRTRVRIPELVVGIMILNADGDVLYGTNSWIEGVELQSDPGSDRRLRFELECGLVPGIYSVTSALANLSRPGFHYDWVDRAAMVQVEGRTGPPAGPRGVTLRRIETGAMAGNCARLVSR
jgi:hypothetical protein